MFKIPVDLIIALKNEFPNIPDIEQVIDKIFEKIFKKTIKDGSCSVMRLGTFFAYKSYSNRLHRIVPRFKFTVSRALRTKLAQDTYILDQIPETRDVPDRINLIIEEKKNTEKKRISSRKRKKKKTPQDEIAAILDEGFYEESKS